MLESRPENRSLVPEERIRKDRGVCRCTRLYESVYMCTSVWKCVHVCVRILCIFVCTYIVCTCVYVYVYTCVCT